MASFERDPKKRRVKPVPQQSLLDFDLGESSDDSDFRIEDHDEESDDDSIDSEEEDGGGAKAVQEDEEDEDDDDDDDFPSVKLKISPQVGPSVGSATETESQKTPVVRRQFDTKDVQKVLICCGCLGDRSDDTNEIVECDSCGVTVHEGCYGVADNASVSSTVSSCSTEPWFCEACKAGVTNPSCELCPNLGGIFKETDVGKWVHLVCALYMPGVAFGEVDRLSNVTLFEMQSSRWGAKACHLCEDDRFARTGVCIGCDAGMCRTYFHVTCAQREGLLSEAHSEEVDQADPFYAHCKLHSDKTHMRRRRRNWLALQLRTQQRQLERQQAGHDSSAEQVRIRRKLGKQRERYAAHKGSRNPPWVPIQKTPRLLSTSASACRRFLHKAELMGVDTAALEVQEAQVASLMDVRKKWHIPPAFSVEFIGYYLDRNVRLTSLKRRIKELLDARDQLLNEENNLRVKCNQLYRDNMELSKTNAALWESVQKLHTFIQSVAPGVALPAISLPSPAANPPGTGASVGAIVSHATPALHSNPSSSASSVASAPAAKKTTTNGFRDSSESMPLSFNECGICHLTKDQHLLAKCDTCHKYYHLGCLNPPLSRMPKKTKLMGWQCSECDKESSGSEVECVDTEAPRKLRRNHKEGDSTVLEPPTPKLVATKVPEVIPFKQDVTVVVPPVEQQAAIEAFHPEQMTPSSENMMVVGSSGRQGKKRHKEKHRGEDGEERKKRRKKKSLTSAEELPPISPTNMEPHPRIKIKIKSIPMPDGGKGGGKSGGSGGPGSGMHMFVATTPDTSVVDSTVVSQPAPTEPAEAEPTTGAATAAVSSRRSGSRSSAGMSRNAPKKVKEVDIMTRCDVCFRPGSNINLVRCDECLKCFHFTCLDPPLKKSPKPRGYSWHCADCDPTDTDSKSN
ncbi:PHD finger protein 14 isoform X2 [Ischnura elegans]|uniref:PHD finger protein 14 isoform X2 n=1 Tax=Ischnura elegans TaxID=197161 RepID=UPI001ED8B1BA|nr:PHD finger protein 14 isoform X2 [Ischnura elegans]